MTAPQPDEVRAELPGGGHLVGDHLAGGPLTLLFVHGFGGVRRGEKSLALAAECARRGHGFAAFDFHSHGQTGGPMSELRPSRLLGDMAAVYRYLEAAGAEHVVPVGSSMGGWAAAWSALDPAAHLPGVVLLAPALRFPDARWLDLSPQLREAWRRTGRLRVSNRWIDIDLGYDFVEDVERYPFDKLADAWTLPALIVHGTQDDVIPFRQSVEFVERVGRPQVELRPIDGGDHRLTGHAPLLARLACDFAQGVASG